MKANPLPIHSLQNDRVKAVVRLRTARERRQRNLTVVEEPLVLERALAAGVEWAEVWLGEEPAAGERETLRLALAAAAPTVYRAPRAVMDRISYRERSDGMLGVIRTPQAALDDLTLPIDRAPLLLVVENLEKPGNLGAVQRIADGAGADAVLVCGEKTDLYNPNVLRASRGACFHVPSVAAGPDAIGAYLAAHRIRTVAASPHADRAWNEVDLTGPVAVVLGAEHEGLSERWLTAADLAVALPMRGVGDSLNISTTAAILLYESLRQRTAAAASNGPGKATR